MSPQPSRGYRPGQQAVWSVKEKDVERAGDQLMIMLGFKVWRFSQARATHQTEGIPDRLYTHRAKGLAVFWEAKRPGGKLRREQVEFSEQITAAKIDHVWGTSDVLIAWAKAKGLLL